jgi:hypothetical protein
MREPGKSVFLFQATLAGELKAADNKLKTGTI